MKLSYRVFAGYCIVLAIAGWLFFREFTTELTPAMRQSLEEALVDTANLLAEVVADTVEPGNIGTDAFAAAVERFAARELNARIFSRERNSPDLFVYLTDARGIVVFDSRGDRAGEDYSQWNDVYRTLRGEYGARTTREDPDDPTSSIMFVAAPVERDGRLLGVLTVGKPSISVQPYIDQLRSKLLDEGLWLVLASLALAALLAYGQTRSVARLTRFARDIRDGRRPAAPAVGEPELDRLATAIDEMRRELEGKDYVEEYLLSMTHELKSPLAAIHGAVELLGEPMSDADREHFLGNIRGQTRRMQQVVERLLDLARVEKRHGLEDAEPVDIARLVEDVVDSRAMTLAERGLSIERNVPAGAILHAEKFLLRQAIANLLDNAIDFSPDGGTIVMRASLELETWRFQISDQGPGVPDYARDRVFERFYSLDRPGGHPRSSGLGLSFVREVALLHGGSASLENGPSGGAVATLAIPVHASLTSGTS